MKLYCYYLTIHPHVLNLLSNPYYCDYFVVKTFAILLFIIAFLFFIFILLFIITNIIHPDFNYIYNFSLIRLFLSRHQSLARHIFFNISNTKINLHLRKILNDHEVRMGLSKVHAKVFPLINNHLDYHQYFKYFLNCYYRYHHLHLRYYHRHYLKMDQFNLPPFK